MKNYFVFLTAALFMLYACSNNADKTIEKLVAKGDCVYGGCFRMAIPDNYQSLYFTEVSDANSCLIFTQINDGLVKLNTATLKPEPCLARSWDISESGTKYTFHLKKGAMFQDDECFEGGKGRAITAADVVYSFELLCKKDPHNQNFASTFKDKVVGANKFYEEEVKNLEGVQMMNDSTVVVQLERPSSMFLSILSEPACAIVAKEAIEQYGKNIKTAGAGAFILDINQSNKEQIVLKRNPTYHGKDKLGNQLPFLDSIIVYIVPLKEKELTMFKDGKIDMIVTLPANALKEMVQDQIKDFQDKPIKYILDNSPEMITQFYTFNTTRPPFNNSKVRKAFNMAINRQKIVDDVLNGQAFGPGIRGITPPTFTSEGYDITKIQGYDFNPKEAKKLLAEAGYPNGKNFPMTKVLLNAGGARNTNVVVEIQKQLNENLGISIDFDVISFAQKLENSRNGKTDIVRDAWIADYPSPETFLDLFYGPNVPLDSTQPSYTNTTRYKNPEFDKYFELGRHSISIDSAMANFMKAEQIMMNDAPIMVLWYEGDYRLIEAKVKNTYTNALLYRNFSETYIKDESIISTKKDSVFTKK